MLKKHAEAFKRRNAMKFGLCTAEDARKFGADFSELNAQAIYGMSEEELSSVKERVKNGKLLPYAANCLVPGSLRLTGPDVDYGKIREYTEKCFERLAELGINMIVFGSSAAKAVPEGFSMEKAWEQLFEAGRIFSDVAKKHGQTVAVEGLNRHEVNIVNTLSDVYYYVKGVDRENFRMLADFYHIYKNGESISDVKKYKALLAHCHIAGFLKRAVPVKEEAGFIKDCISALKDMGYDGTVSFEGVFDINDEKGLTNMFADFKKYAK